MNVDDSYKKKKIEDLQTFNLKKHLSIKTFNF